VTEYPGEGRLTGRVALVTGAASGIGAACARRFREEGAVVVGFDLQEPPEAGPFAEFDVGDVRDESRVRSLVERTVDAHGSLDVVLNAAGVVSTGAAHQLALEEWERAISINLTGTFVVAKHALSIMIGQRSGSVVNVASIEGLEGIDVAAAYNASKGGVVALTRQLAVDYGRLGIRVNCLCPGVIETPMTAPLQSPGMEEYRDTIAAAHLLGRLGRPEEIAGAAAFLASDDASFVTGHALVVDGGITAGHRFGMADLMGLH
jgi:meso-butanediol dehydrogenase / (S,S)-butanediol dehydrogenase / diacetyl reductase